MTISAQATSEWMRFLEARHSDEAETEVRRLIRLLEGSLDDLTRVIKHVSGCPAVDLEEQLRIGRTVISEGVEELDRVIRGFRLNEVHA